jgi:hypothetical protein
LNFLQFYQPAANFLCFDFWGGLIMVLSALISAGLSLYQPLVLSFMLLRCQLRSGSPVPTLAAA